MIFYYLIKADIIFAVLLILFSNNELWSTHTYFNKSININMYIELYVAFNNNFGHPFN